MMNTPKTAKHRSNSDINLSPRCWGCSFWPSLDPCSQTTIHDGDVVLQLKKDSKIFNPMNKKKLEKAQQQQVRSDRGGET